ncbi:MAG: glycosyltransferase [Bacteroidota bacterium]
MSSQKLSILFLGTTKFDGSDQSTSFSIARELAKNNAVYYIDYPFTFRDCFRAKNKQQLKSRWSFFSPFSGRVIESDSGLKIIILPPLLSINFLKEGQLYRKLLKFNELVIRLKLKQVLKNHGISDYVYFNSFNFHYPGVTEGLKPALEIYHCVDPMIMPYDKKHGIVSEKVLVKNSDLVICTSRQLYNEKKELNANTYFVPNAADSNYFNKTFDKATITDPRITAIPKPIIGYIGTIERRMDYKLIRDVAEQNLDKSFVFVGPKNEDYIPEWFRSIQNVHLMGPVTYDETPSVLKGFDVAIIPFTKDEVSASIFPLKLFEYLASGKPVVATDFNPDLREFTGNTVTFCDGAFAFSKALNEALINDNDDKRLNRLEISRKNTWETRAADIEKLIEMHLSNSKPSS